MATNTSLQMGSGNVLTVGAGMEFATLGDACKAAVAGDTIAVQAGTYVNDFATVSCALKIVSIGGLVNEVATVEPPNGKALLTADASLSIQGFTFTGGSDGSPDGNVAGIRLENGNLAVSYCYFHDMEEGVLAGADSTASITIDHSEFARNGSGDGYSHNLYAGAIASLTVTNSYFTASNVGHEIKSRAAVTNISNNVIADGPTGTGSYDIDLPNGGVATITNNIIEKGPLSSNVYAIHYSGETQFTYAKNALTVTGNTILNDAGPTGLAVLNQDWANNLDVPANVSHNSFYGYAAGQLLSGHGTLSANTTLAKEPGYSTASPYAAVPILALAAGPQLLNLTNSYHDVSGGAARLTIMDSAGSNTINGGAGGINLTDSLGWDTISTAAGASDAIILGGRNAVLHSAGNDHIAAPGFYEDVFVTGQSTITGSAFNSYNLDGAGEKLTASGSGVIDVGAAGCGRHHHHRRRLQPGRIGRRPCCNQRPGWRAGERQRSDGQRCGNRRDLAWRLGLADAGRQRRHGPGWRRHGGRGLRGRCGRADRRRRRRRLHAGQRCRPRGVRHGCRHCHRRQRHGHLRLPVRPARHRHHNRLPTRPRRAELYGLQR